MRQRRPSAKMGSEEEPSQNTTGPSFSEGTPQELVLFDKKMTLEEKLAFVSWPDSSLGYFQELRDDPIKTFAFREAVECFEKATDRFNFELEAIDGSHFSDAIMHVADVLWPHPLKLFFHRRIKFVAPNRLGYIATLDVVQTGRCWYHPPTVTVRDEDTTRKIELKSFFGFYDVFEAILDCEVAYLKRPFIFPFPDQPFGLNTRDNGLTHDHENRNGSKSEPQNLEVHDEGAREHRNGESDSELVSTPKIRKDSTRPQYDCDENSITQRLSLEIEHLARQDQHISRGAEIMSTWHLRPDPGEYVDMVHEMLTSAIEVLLRKSPNSAHLVKALERQTCEETKLAGESVRGEHAKSLTLLKMEDEVYVRYSSPFLETTIDEVREPCGKKRQITNIWL